MNKLLGLRDRILSIANIQQDTITAYASDGHMVGRAPDVFEYAYKAEITITEYNGSADNVLWPVYAWLLDHEPNLRDDQFQFEVDIASWCSAPPISTGVRCKASARWG